MSTESLSMLIRQSRKSNLNDTGEDIRETYVKHPGRVRLGLLPFFTCRMVAVPASVNVVHPY
jgi:hypothetical protein